MGLVLIGGAMHSKSLIQFSVDGWGCVPSLLFTWGPTMVTLGKYGLPWWLNWHKNLPAMWKTWVQSLGWEDPLEKATQSSILAWRIPWTV